MADLDTALAEALRHHDPTWTPPDISEHMRRERAELIDWDEREYPRRDGDGDDEADDFLHDDRAAGDDRPCGTGGSVVNEAPA